MKTTSNAIFIVFNSDNDTNIGTGFEAELATVSCRHDQNVNNRQLKHDRQQPVVYSNAINHKPTCGKPYIDPLNVDGIRTNSYSWPWHVSIRLRGAHICDGALLSPRFVITNAHCFKGLNDQLTNFELWMGKKYRNEEFEAGNEQRLTPLSVEFHPKFEKFYDFQYDLALISIAGLGAKQTNVVQPVCILENGKTQMFPVDSSYCMVTGFATDPADDSLRQLRTPVINQTACENSDRNLKVKIKELLFFFKMN